MLKAYEEVRLTRGAPGPDSRATLWRHVLGGKEIAARFAARMRTVPAPDTDAGKEARKWLETYARNSLEIMVREERFVRKLPEDITLLESIRGLERVEVALINVFFNITGISGPFIDFVPELKEAFEASGSCRELDALGED